MGISATAACFGRIYSCDHPGMRQHRMELWNQCGDVSCGDIFKMMKLSLMWGSMPDESDGIDFHHWSRLHLIAVYSSSVAGPRRPDVICPDGFDWILSPAPVEKKPQIIRLAHPRHWRLENL